MKEKWTTIDRPGFAGKKRDQKHEQYDRQFGVGNWRVVWELGTHIFTREEIVLLYEDAYYHFFKNNLEILERLIKEAKNVYDNDPSNIDSGINYTKQKNEATHLQDIAIRRIILRFGKKLSGKRLIQIRSTSDHELGKMLSPGRIPFHMPELIKQPELKSWFDPKSIEAFYQSCKVLQIKLKK